ncbi:MAG TPA: hypothetical protein VFB37_16890 [Steroidobacteraceae bacterium]|nr:hypothetical protein [Steroidobacteraceae bacterium]
MSTRKRSGALILLAWGALWAACLAGCASDRLVASAPGGVNLTGNWKLDLNLSDDPDRLLDQDKSLSKPASSGRHHGHQNPGSDTGLPPMGTPDGPVPRFAGSSAPLDARSFEADGISGPTARESSLSEQWTGGPSPAPAPGIEQSNPLPPSNTPSEADTSANRGRSVLARVLAAPSLLVITQDGPKVSIRSRMADGTGSADEFVAGTKAKVPYGKDSTAERESGWRGPVFVTTTKTNSGWREDDYALDEDGRLIVTSDIKAGHLKQLEIKHVYDRIAP